MSLFILDTIGDEELIKSDAKKRKKSNILYNDKKDKQPTVTAEYGNETDENDSEDDNEYYGLPPPNVDLSKIISSTLTQTTQIQNKLESDMDYVSEIVNAAAANTKQHKRTRRMRITQLDHSDFNELTGKYDDEKLIQIDVDGMKSNFVSGLEKMKDMAVIPKRKQIILNKVERSKTKGPGWFNLPATETTPEIKNELKLIQMRSVLDPKHFYKKNDLKVLPKYFQIGTVQHSPLDYYSERNTRKNKKKSLVDELLEDAEFQKYTKRKYNEIMAKRDKYAHRKTMKKMKKLKKNK